MVNKELNTKKIRVYASSHDNMTADQKKGYNEAGYFMKKYKKAMEVLAR